MTDSFALPRGFYEPPSEPDDSTRRYVRCAKCGVVAHNPIPDDEQHCNCWEIYDGEYGAGWRDDCPCPCHGEES